VFKAGWLVLASLMAGYFAARPLGLLVSVVAGAAALLLMLPVLLITLLGLAAWLMMLR
jgi:arsenical pump membrane protein